MPRVSLRASVNSRRSPLSHITLTLTLTLTVNPTLTPTPTPTLTGVLSTLTDGITHPLAVLQPTYSLLSRRASLRASLISASVENSDLTRALAPGAEEGGLLRDELRVDKHEEDEEQGQGEGEWGEGALPGEWDERARTAVGEAAAASRASSHAAAPAASRSGLVMLGLVQLALTSPFASFETLVTPFTEVSMTRYR